MSNVDIAGARAIAEKYLKGATVEACVPYKNDFLVRVKHPPEEEAHYDPFFIVSSAGVLQEFSVMTDGDPVEIAAAFQAAEST